MPVERLEAQIIMKLDKSSAQQTEKDVEAVRLRSAKTLDLAINLGKLRKELENVKGLIKQAQDNGNLTAEIQFRGRAEVLKKEITKANRELLNFTRTGDEKISVLGKLFDDLGNKIGGPSGNLIKGFGRLGDSLKGVFSNVAFAAGAGAIAFGLKKIGDQAIFLGDRLEQASISFEVMLGSAEKAQDLLSELSTFAQKTPFELTGIRDTAKQLLAFGIEQDNIISSLKILGDVAAGVGAPIQQIAYAYGQVRTANQLYGTELRQFSNAGVPLIAELAKQFGVTEGEVRDLVESGKVGFKDVEKAFISMTSEGGKFFNLMERQSTTLSGRISNLKDSFNQLLEGLGTALLPFAKGFTLLLKTAADNIGLVTVALGGLTVALGIAFGGPIIASIAAFLGVFAAPVAIIAGLTVGVIALAGALGGLADDSDSAGTSMTEFGAKVDELKGKVKGLKESLEEVKDEIKDLDEQYNQGTISIDDYKEKSASLTQEQKKLEEQLGLTKDELDIAKDKYSDLGKEIKKVEGEQTLLRFQLQEGVITQGEYDTAIEETRKKLRLLKGTTIEVYNEQGVLVEVNKQLIFGFSDTQTALNKLSTAKSVGEFNKLRNEILAAEADLLRIRKQLAFDAQIKVLNLRDNPLTDPKALKEAEAEYLKINSLISQSNAILEAGNKAQFVKPVGGGGTTTETKNTGGGGKSLAEQRAEATKKAEKERVDATKDAYVQIKSILDKEVTAQKKSIADIEKELKTLEDAIKKLKDLDDEIKSVGDESGSDIAGRFLEIESSIARTNKEIAGFDFQTGDIEEYNALQAELIRLEEEKALALANTTEEQRKEAERQAGLSDTQRILEAAAARKADLEAKKLEIEEEIGFTKEKAEERVELLKQEKLESENVLLVYEKAVEEAENSITAITKTNTDARIVEYNREMEKLRALIALQAKAGVSPNAGGSQANTTSNTVNNSPTVIVNATVSNGIDVKKLGDQLAKDIALSSKGIS